jgi:ribonuclease P protein component
MPHPPETRPNGAAAPEEVVAGTKSRARNAKRRVDTLKRRAEFLATRNGARWATPFFALEALKRGPSGETDGARFGFTVSKKVGGAVDRNRIKRRLKAAVAQVQGEQARPDFDYVLIARRPALDATFDALVAELAKAIGRVNSQKPGRPARKPAAKGKAP